MLPIIEFFIFLCICNYSIISSNNPSVFIQSLAQKNSFYNEENLRFKFEIQNLSNIEKISPINETTIFFTDVKDIHNIYIFKCFGVNYCIFMNNYIYIFIFWKFN